MASDKQLAIPSMKSSYRKAIVAGTALGLYALVSSALSPHVFDAGSSLPIPTWDTRLSSGTYDHIQTLTIGLEFQAVFLRFCFLLIESGFWYFVVPIVLCCSFAQLTEFGRTNFVARLLVRSIKLTGLMLGLLYMLAMWPTSLIIIGTQPWQLVIPEMLLTFPFLLMLAIKMYLVPPIWIIAFLIEWWRLSGKWETIREQNSAVQ
jgi:hypothetical protein